MRRGSPLAALLAVAGAFLPGPAASSAPAPVEEPVSLRLQFRRGDALVWKVVSRERQAQSSPLAGGDAAAEHRFEWTFEQRVADVDASGRATSRCAIGRVWLELEMGGSRVVYDSRDEPGEKSPDEGLPGFAEAVAVFRALPGKSFTLVQAPDATLVSVKGFGDIVEGALARPGGGDAGPEAPILRALVQQQLGDEAMRDELQRGAGHLPKGAVRPGDSWTGTLREPLSLAPASLRVETTYTLAGPVRDGEATVSARASVSLVERKAEPGDGPLGDTSPLAALLARLKPSLRKSEHSGTFVYDAAGGALKSSRVVRVREVELEMGAPGAPEADSGAEGLLAKLSTRSETETTLVSRSRAAQGF
ncbi:MAG: DUF6263 family protein [Planctomycetales bacterium]|nr:DUF6263 family protein [Planctomycetales bacterium]